MIYVSQLSVFHFSRSEENFTLVQINKNKVMPWWGKLQTHFFVCLFLKHFRSGQWQYQLARCVQSIFQLLHCTLVALVENSHSMVVNHFGVGPPHFAQLGHPWDTLGKVAFVKLLCSMGGQLLVLLSDCRGAAAAAVGAICTASSVLNSQHFLLLLLWWRLLLLLSETKKPLQFPMRAGTGWNKEAKKEQQHVSTVGIRGKIFSRSYAWDSS